MNLNIDLTQIIIVLITAVLVPFLTIYLRKLAAKADAEVAKISDQAASTALHDLLWKAESDVEAAVKATFQTYVDGIKGTAGWDATAQATAATKALESFKQLMGDAAMEALGDAVGDVETWAQTQIEAAVQSLKKPAAVG